MAFSRLFFPIVGRDFYEPDYSSLGLLNLLNDNVGICPRTVIRLNQQTSDNAGRNLDLSQNPNKFQVMLNVKHFKPEELSVKTVDNYVVIHGKHEEVADEHGFVSREFTRRYAIPEGIEPEKVQSSLNQDGVLTIQAPLKCLEPPPKNERVVRINIQQTAAVEQQQKAQEQQQKAQEQQQKAQEQQQKAQEQQQKAQEQQQKAREQLQQQQQQQMQVDDQGDAK